MWGTIVFAFVLLEVCVSVQDGPRVSTNVGDIRGVRRESFTSYLGIPYGVIYENNVFGAAAPPPHFDSEYLAYEDPPVCPQINQGVPQGTIHCLNLNIYVPNPTEVSHWDEPYIPPPAVMVFIHGGGFVEGNGNMATYSPKFLVEKGVIVVTVNYRLGPYGFICLPDLGYSNQGLKDIIMALKWVKDNIRSFGGDDEQITVFGHSAGSVSVDFILLYNEDNVFSNAILQSGQAVSPFMVAEPKNEGFVTRLAEKLDIDTTNLNIKDIMTELSNTNTDLLINATKFDEFRPCVDGEFITQTPKNKTFNDTRIIIGTTAKEMIFFYKGNETSIENTFKKDLNKGFSNLPNSAFDIIKSSYPGYGVDKIIDYSTDYIFTYPAERSVRFYLRNKAIVYRYVFSYDGDRNFMKIRDNITENGAAHGDELGYIFDNEILGDTINVHDQRVLYSMTKLWTNFAKYGNPTSSRSGEDNPVQKWYPVDMEWRYFMNRSSIYRIEEGPFDGRMSFWDMFYEFHGKSSKGFNFGEYYMLNGNKSAVHGNGSSALSSTLVLVLILLSVRQFI